MQSTIWITHIHTIERTLSLENRKSGLAEEGQDSLWAKAEDRERKNTYECVCI